MAVEATGDAATANDAVPGWDADAILLGSGTIRFPELDGMPVMCRLLSGERDTRRQRSGARRSAVVSRWVICRDVSQLQWSKRKSA